MTDITAIPTSELEKDLLESHQDIAICETALTLEISSYSGGSVKERLEANKHFVKVITAELERRRNLKPKLCPECDSEILPDQTCMMGHWCGEPVVPVVDGEEAKHIFDK